MGAKGRGGVPNFATEIRSPSVTPAPLRPGNRIRPLPSMSQTPSRGPPSEFPAEMHGWTADIWSSSSALPYRSSSALAGRGCLPGSVWEPAWEGHGPWEGNGNGSGFWRGKVFEASPPITKPAPFPVPSHSLSRKISSFPSNSRVNPVTLRVGTPLLSAGTWAIRLVRERRWPSRGSSPKSSCTRPGKSRIRKVLQKPISLTHARAMPGQ